MENMERELQAKDREIKQLNQKIDALLGIIMQSASGSATGGKDTLIEEIKKRDKEIERLKNELSIARTAETEAERLASANEELERKLSIITNGQKYWRNAVNSRILKSYKTMALAICHKMKGFCASDIVMRLREQSVCADTATVYRALSVKGDNDRERIASVYTTYPEIFEEHGISKEELIHWFQSQRISKLCLVSQEDLDNDLVNRLKEYGIQPDRYVKGNYYRKEDIEYIKQALGTGKAGNQVQAVRY